MTKEGLRQRFLKRVVYTIDRRIFEAEHNRTIAEIEKLRNQCVKNSAMWEAFNKTLKALDSKRRTNED